MLAGTRRAEMTTAEAQWDLLHRWRPQTQRSRQRSPEPAYEIGGDSFVTPSTPAGSTSPSSMQSVTVWPPLMSTSAINSLRNSRRERRTLEDSYRQADSIIERHFGNSNYVTGQFGSLDLETGVLTWVNAGHLLPMLVRNGSYVGELQCRPSMPMGLGGPVVEIAQETLQRGDRVLFYTDGISESLSCRRRFGQNLGRLPGARHPRRPSRCRDSPPPFRRRRRSRRRRSQRRRHDVAGRVSPSRHREPRIYSSRIHPDGMTRGRDFDAAKRADCDGRPSGDERLRQCNKSSGPQLDLAGAATAAQKAIDEGDSLGDCPWDQQAVVTAVAGVVALVRAVQPGTSDGQVFRWRRRHRLLRHLPRQQIGFVGGHHGAAGGCAPRHGRPAAVHRRGMGWHRRYCDLRRPSRSTVRSWCIADDQCIAAWQGDGLFVALVTFGVTTTTAADAAAALGAALPIVVLTRHEGGRQSLTEMSPLTVAGLGTSR